MVRYEKTPISGSELIKLARISYGQIIPIRGTKFLPLAWIECTSRAHSKERLQLNKHCNIKYDNVS